MDSKPMHMKEPPTGERSIPKHIRRSLLCLSIDDPHLGVKAYASWADAIILDCIKARGRDWQADLRAKMPAAIHDAGKGGAEVFVRINGDTAAAELESIVFAGIDGIVLKGVNDGVQVREASERRGVREGSRGMAGGALEVDVEVSAAGGVGKSLGGAR